MSLQCVFGMCVRARLRMYVCLLFNISPRSFQEAEWVVTYCLKIKLHLAFFHSSDFAAGISSLLLVARGASQQQQQQ